MAFAIPLKHILCKYNRKQLYFYYFCIKISANREKNKIYLCFSEVQPNLSKNMNKL